jgi:hypothetical protein
MPLTARAQSLNDDLSEGHSRLLQVAGIKIRTIDGSENNVGGMVGSQLRRLTTVSYADGISAPAGAYRPSTRDVSNECAAQTDTVPNTAGVTDFFWLWGQFIDHDIDLAGPAYPAEPFDISVPAGDPYFDPDWTGSQVIRLDRSTYDPLTGTGINNPRQQINEITAFIDASQVYGSDRIRAEALRTNDGTGRLKMSFWGLLPFNTEGLPNAGGDDDPTLILAGDVRANEHVALTALHTLFVREHNLLAYVIRKTNQWMSGDAVYELARAIVGAEIQVITYQEYLPLLLGPHALTPYNGHSPEVNPGISNIFATVAYRFGHSMVSPTLLRLDTFGSPVPVGPLALRHAFFAPWELQFVGVDPLLRGLASQVCQDVDMQVVDDLRNFLFSPPPGGFDLAALNMQRGRDHGLPSYNQARSDFGLDPVEGFEDFPADPVVQAQLALTYGDVDEIDAWVGGLAENHYPGALVGELFFHILTDQFERLRDGDRFWYQNVFPRTMITTLENITLADIIRRNTAVGYEIQDNVFLYEPEPPGLRLFWKLLSLPPS